MLNRKLIANKLRRIASQLENTDVLFTEVDSIKNFSGKISVWDYLKNGEKDELIYELEGNGISFSVSEDKITASNGLKIYHADWEGAITTGWDMPQTFYGISNIQLVLKTGEFIQANFKKCSFKNELNDEIIDGCTFEDCVIPNLGELQLSLGNSKSERRDTGYLKTCKFINCKDTSGKKYEDFEVNSGFDW